MLSTNKPLGKRGACFITIVDHPNQTTAQSIAFLKFKLATTCTGIYRQKNLLADDDATLTFPAPGISPSHQEMEDTSLHAAALICPNLKDGIEASNAQCLELLKNATIEKDEEDVSSILFYSIFE